MPWKRYDLLLWHCLVIFSSLVLFSVIHVANRADHSAQIGESFLVLSHSVIYYLCPHCLCILPVALCSGRLGYQDFDRFFSFALSVIEGAFSGLHGEVITFVFEFVYHFLGLSGCLNSLYLENPSDLS